MPLGQTVYLPANGGCVLPIARLGRLGWFVEGDGWTMQPRCCGKHLTLSEEKAICAAAAAALRAAKRSEGPARTSSKVRKAAATPPCREVEGSVAEPLGEGPARTNGN